MKNRERRYSRWNDAILQTSRVCKEDQKETPGNLFLVELLWVLLLFS